jgi:uncharacterized membrane protein YfcA
MLLHDLTPWAVFLVTFLASILSGITSGGGGYILTPFMIAIGLTPQQSIATVKLWALGIDSGSIAAYRDRPIKHKKLALYLIITGIIIGGISAVAIRHIGNQNLQVIMGTLNLVMVPLLFIKHHKIKSRTRNFIFQAFGWAAMIALMLLQGIFASGVGILINVVLIAVFGISVLETILIKRKFSFAGDLVVLVGLLGSGLINFKYGILMAIAGWTGGFIGSRFALHEGERFARYALMLLMVGSGAWLIATA